MNEMYKFELEMLDILYDVYRRMLIGIDDATKLALVERQFAEASGKLQGSIGWTNEIRLQTERIVTLFCKPIFDNQPDITHSLEETRKMQDKVLEWVKKIREAEVESQKLFFDIAMQKLPSDMTKVADATTKISELLMDQSVTDFIGFVRNTFIEHKIKEMRQIAQRDNIQDLYKRLKIHPRIRKVSEKLFLAGNYRNAILDAFIEIEKMTREKSKEDKAGFPLFGTVFNEINPILKLNSLASRTDIDEQKGFMFIFQGASLGIRNPKAHDTLVQTDPHRTLEYLSLASLLAKRIDESEKVQTP